MDNFVKQPVLQMNVQSITRVESRTALRCERTLYTVCDLFTSDV